MADENQQAPGQEAQQPVVDVKVLDDEIKDIIGTGFGSDYSKLASLLPSFTASNGSKMHGVEWLNPGKAKQRERFLKEKDYTKARGNLKQRLSLWKELLEGSSDPDGLIQSLNERVGKLDKNFKANMSNVYETIRPFEVTYRGIANFFSNCKKDPDEAVDVFFTNLKGEDLVDPDEPERFEKVTSEISTLFRQFSIDEAYSLMVVPGYLGNVQKIDNVARQIGFANKVHVITDMEDFESYEEAKDMLSDETFKGLASTEEYKQYMSVCANYMLGRKKNEFEEEDVWIPPSTAVAGLIFRNDSEVGIQQPSAGYDHGKIADVENSRFKLNQPTASELVKKNVVPTLYWDGSVRTMGHTTLYNGETFNNYSIRRTYDYIYKTIRHYINKQTFKVVDEKYLTTIKTDLLKFMNYLKKNKDVLQDFSLEVFADDEMRKAQQVDINVTLNPKYPALAFNIALRTWKEGETVNVDDK